MATLITGATQTYTVPLTAIPSGQPSGLVVFLTSDSAGNNVVAQSAVMPFNSKGQVQSVAGQLVAPLEGIYYVWVVAYMNGQPITVSPQGTVQVSSDSLLGGAGVSTQNVVTGQRAVNTVYRNTTGKPMFVSASIVSNQGTSFLLTDEKSNPTTQMPSWAQVNKVSFIGWILPGNYYEAVSGADGYPTIWIEWY